MCRWLSFVNLLVGCVLAVTLVADSQESTESLERNAHSPTMLMSPASTLSTFRDNLRGPELIDALQLPEMRYASWRDRSDWRNRAEETNPRWSRRSRLPRSGPDYALHSDGQTFVDAGLGNRKPGASGLEMQTELSPCGARPE